MEWKVCLTHLHMASSGKWSPDFLILSPTAYPLGHMFLGYYPWVWFQTNCLHFSMLSELYFLLMSHCKIYSQGWSKNRWINQNHQFCDILGWSVWSSCNDQPAQPLWGCSPRRTRSVCWLGRRTRGNTKPGWGWHVHWDIWWWLYRKQGIRLPACTW